jgi:hypothetical protein
VSECLGQKLLFHKNNFKETTYQAGETITFQIKGDDSKIRDRIVGFDKDFIVFSNFKISPEEISHIYVDKKTRTWFIFRYKYQIVLPIIGIGYMILDWLNTGALSKETAVAGTSFVIAGLLAKILISEKIKIKGRRKLVIIHSDIPAFRKN